MSVAAAVYWTDTNANRVAMYYFETLDATGVVDSSANGYSGYITGAVATAIGPRTIDGSAETAYSFIGDDWIAVAQAGITNVNIPWTLAATVNPASFTNFAFAVNLGNSAEANTICGFSVAQVNSSNRFRLFMRNTAGTDSMVITSTASYATNEWHHLAATYDGATNYTFYIDGTQDVVRSDGDIGATTLNVTGIGALRRSTLMQFWNGKIDDVREYLECLSSNAVWDMATQTTHPAGSTESR